MNKVSCNGVISIKSEALHWKHTDPEHGRWRVYGDDEREPWRAEAL